MLQDQQVLMEVLAQQKGYLLLRVHPPHLVGQHVGLSPKRKEIGDPAHSLDVGLKIQGTMAKNIKRPCLGTFVEA